MDKQLIEENLVELCKMMIEKFNQAKKFGLITEEDYERHTKHKIEFLKIHDN